MKSIKLFVLVAVTATASCFAMKPTVGWMSKNIPAVSVKVPLSEEAGIMHVSPEITSIAMDKNYDPWVTTKDGKLLRYGRRIGSVGSAFGSIEKEWQDVSSIISSQHDKKEHAPSKFKYVTSTPYAGGICAVDEDGRIYQWFE